MDPPQENELSIPLLKVPEFKPHLNPEDLDDLTRRDIKLLLSFSVAAQQLDFLTNYVKVNNEQTRGLKYLVLAQQAEIKVCRDEIESQRQWRGRLTKRWLWVVGLVSAGVTALVSGMMAHIAQWVIKHLSE